MCLDFLKRGVAPRTVKKNDSKGFLFSLDEFNFWQKFAIHFTIFRKNDITVSPFYKFFI